MINLMGKWKRVWFLISLIIIIPGTISLFVNGLRLSIDFTGGSLFEISPSSESVKAEDILKEYQVEIVSMRQASDNTVEFRTKEVDEDRHREITSAFKEAGLAEERFETVGPSVSKDITTKAFTLVGFAAAAVVLYIAYAFRKVPKPASPWRFGVSTIAALLHDVLLLVGIFSILGRYAGVEIDSLFVTAVLTVIGFSVHDTIVVFDRIRENLRRYERMDFEGVVNASVIETLVRSINTSLTVLITLAALYIFGGASIKTFVLALLIGIASGTFSSIFNASPLLVVWQNWSTKRRAVRAA